MFASWKSCYRFFVCVCMERGSRHILHHQQQTLQVPDQLRVKMLLLVRTIIDIPADQSHLISLCGDSFLLVEPIEIFKKNQNGALL